MTRSSYGLAVAAAVAAASSWGGARTAQAQVQCARPNVPATTVYAAFPDAPALAIQQGISGVVQIIVSLDAQNRVVGTRVQSSPSSILNNAALTAARQSKFQTEIRDCQPIAADYVFTVDFVNGTPRVMRDAAGVPSVTIAGEGVVSRAPDVAFVEAYVLSVGDDAAAAAANNAATIAALAAKLRPLGVAPDQIRTSVPLGLADRPSPGFSAGSARTLSIRVDNLRDVAKVADAVASAGPRTSVRSVQYGLRDDSRAYEEAVAGAIQDARTRAESIAANEQLHVASVARVVVGQRLRPPSMVSRAVAADVQPGPIEVRATVTVTFLLKR